MGKRRALGRGLDAIIPASDSAAREVRLDDIAPGRSQPRRRFEDDTVRALAESIRLHGLLQPLIVSARDGKGKYHLIAGERRWQAARLAGLERVPVVQRDVTDQAGLEIALVENIQRQDLDPLEEAAAFQQLIREHALTQEDVAMRVGRDRATIANTLRLLALPPAVKAALIEETISQGHARALLGLDSASTMEATLTRVVGEGLNVRQTERLVASIRDAHGRRVPPKQEKSAELREVEDRLRERLGTKVSVLKGRKAGRIVIEYYSENDLRTLVEMLMDET